MAIRSTAFRSLSVGHAPISALCLAFLLSRAAALEVDFTVTDKLGKPIDGAKICLQEDGGQCTQTNAQGQSAFSPTVGSHPRPATRAPLRFALASGRLHIDAPMNMPARLSRRDLAGRSLGPDRLLSLKAGENSVALDARESRPGLVFFALEAQGTRYTTTAVSLATGEAGYPVRYAALGKAAATANLHAMIISKPGFQSVTYRPRKDLDTGVVIRLSAEGDSGIRYSGLIHAKVVSLDTANHILHYSYTENKCNGALPVAAEQNASLPLWIKDNRWYFPAGNCQGVALSTTGAGLFGQWRTQGVVDLPTGLFPISCDPGRDSVVTSVLNLFFISEGGGWDIDLRSDSVTIRLNRQLCPGNQVVFNPASFDGLNGHPLITGNSCREVSFKNSKGEPGKYAFPVASDSLRAVFTYADKNCTTNAVALSIDVNAPKTCPEGQATSMMADTTWQNCVRNTGFVQPVQ